MTVYLSLYFLEKKFLLSSHLNSSIMMKTERLKQSIVNSNTTKRYTYTNSCLREWKVFRRTVRREDVVSFSTKYSAS